MSELGPVMNMIYQNKDALINTITEYATEYAPTLLNNAKESALSWVSTCANTVPRKFGCHNWDPICYWSNANYRLADYFTPSEDPQYYLRAMNSCVTREYLPVVALVGVGTLAIGAGLYFAKKYYNDPIYDFVKNQFGKAAADLYKPIANWLEKEVDEAIEKVKQALPDGTQLSASVMKSLTNELRKDKIKALRGDLKEHNEEFIQAVQSSKKKTTPTSPVTQSSVTQDKPLNEVVCDILTGICRAKSSNSPGDLNISKVKSNPLSQ